MYFQLLNTKSALNVVLLKHKITSTLKHSTRARILQSRIHVWKENVEKTNIKKKKILKRDREVYQSTNDKPSKTLHLITAVYRAESLNHTYLID